jgi:hypothetical protein
MSLRRHFDGLEDTPPGANIPLYSTEQPSGAATRAYNNNNNNDDGKRADASTKRAVSRVNKFFSLLLQLAVLALAIAAVVIGATVLKHVRSPQIVTATPPTVVVSPTCNTTGVEELLASLSSVVALQSSVSAALPNGWCGVNAFKWLCPILDTLANTIDDAQTQYAAPYTEEEYAAIHATMVADGEAGFSMVPSSGAGKANTAVSMVFGAPAVSMAVVDDETNIVVELVDDEEDAKRSIPVGKNTRALTTADYNVDYDGDEVDDFAVMHANTGIYQPASAPLKIPSIPDNTMLRFVPDGHDWTVTASSGSTLLTTPSGTYGTPTPGPSFWNLAHPITLFGETYSRLIFDVTGSLWSTKIGNFVNSFVLGNTLFFQNIRLAGFGAPFLINCAFSSASRLPYIFSNATLSMYTLVDVPLSNRSPASATCNAGTRVSSSVPTSTVQIVIYAGSNIVEYRYKKIDNAGMALYSNAYGTVGISAGADAKIDGSIYSLELESLLTAMQTSDTATSTRTFVNPGAIIDAYSTVGFPPRLNHAAIARKLLARTGDVFDQILVVIGSNTNGTSRDDFEAARVSTNKMSYLYPGGSNVGGLGWFLTTSQNAASNTAVGSTTGELEDIAFLGLDLSDLVDTSEKQFVAPHYEAYFQPIVGSPIAKYSDVFNDTFSPYYGTLTTNNKRRLYHEENIRYKRANDWFTQSVLGALTRALVHRYGGFALNYGQPGVSNTTLLAQKAQTISTRSVPLLSPFLHTPLRRGQFTTAGRYSQYRPYADAHSEGRYLIEMRRDPNNPLRFHDADDNTAVFPETDDGRLNTFYSQCAALGKQMFVVAPGSSSVAMSPATQVLAGLRSVESLTLQEDTSFFVDEPQSVYAAVGVNPPMDPIAVASLPASLHANTVICGKRRNFRWSQNVFNGNAIAAVTAITNTAPTSFAFGSPAIMPDHEINRKYSARSPRKGDEQDELQTNSIAQRAGLQAYAAQYRLDEFPIDQPTLTKKQLCNNATVNSTADWSVLRRSLDCVDQKNIAIVVLLPTGTTFSSVDRESTIKLHRVAKTYVNTVATDGYGARGYQKHIGNDASNGFPVYGNATADFLPKYFFGMQPIMK